MNKKIVWLIALILSLAVLSACSASGAECKAVFKVKDDRESLDIIVNPPGEGDEYSMDGGLTRNMHITAGKPTEIEYKGTLTKTYDVSGNVYQIDVLVKAVDDRLSSYKITVTGGVYGDTPFECSK